MKENIRPLVFASKCLGFAACRWNGEMIPDRFVEKLKSHVDFITNCPEAEVGLGVPRDPIRIVERPGGYGLMQLNTARDITEQMERFAKGLVASLNDVDGFILKDRSPSCGLKDVKVYRSLERGSSIGKTSGFFAREVLARFGHLVVETEERLTNFNLRENFLTRIFISAKFRKLKETPEMKSLVQFQAENKLLLMAYSQKELRELGKIVANHEKRRMEDVISMYEERLNKALANPPKYRSTINVMMHALGYFSKRLSSEEKRFFLNYLEEYRREQVPLSVPLSLLRSYIVRFDEQYLKQQTFFDPYPKEFVAVRDSGKGRKA
jgi:uncharacterized protein YbgA (DUF1722 family)/uncharacterized protein YbbK (DUF523 family)